MRGLKKKLLKKAFVQIKKILDKIAQYQAEKQVSIKLNHVKQQLIYLVHLQNYKPLNNINFRKLTMQKSANFTKSKPINHYVTELLLNEDDFKTE